MKTHWIAVSFNTMDEYYRHHASECIKTLDRFGISHDIEEVPAVGSWVENCAYKPKFIKSKLLQYQARPVVWLDVDARVKQYPSLFDKMTADVAVHYRAGTELLSNTMYFNTGSAARELVDLWIEAQVRNPKEWDQKVLQRVIASAGFRYEMLPPEYAAIDFMRVKNPVIVQTQASREIRRRARMRGKRR